MSEDEAGPQGDEAPVEVAEEGVANFLQELSEEDLAELSEGDDGTEASDGLELDTVQSVEIRNIFLTTLPQYLEPVEEMLGQLLSTEPRDEQMKATLLKTLESIHTAAARIGIDDVSIRIDRVCDRLGQLGGGLRPDDDLSGEIETELGALRQLSASAGAEVVDPAGQEPRERARTIFAALGDSGGVDRSVLERFTAAGLVTVDQLEIAALDEVMAVTGLDEATVRGVMRAVQIEQPPVEPSEEYPPGLEGDLARRLRERVEAEASIDELRALIQARRAEIRAMRDGLEAVRARRMELRGELAAIEAEGLESLSALHRARERRARVAAERDEAERDRARVGARLARLRRDKRDADEQHARYAGELADLRAHVQRLLAGVRSD